MSGRPPSCGRQRLHYYVSLDIPRNAFLVEEARRLGIALAPETVERAFYFCPVTG